jgi:putative aldouronate transport system substrate-binding protein
LAPPKTIAELENLMKTFMAAHPGTYGMSLDKYLSEMTWLGPAFKAYPDTWFTGSDGSIVYGGIQPEMKNLLSTFADWYKKGYFLKDFMSQDSAAVRQDLVSGKFGVQIFAQWWGYGNGADVVKNLGNNAYFEAYEFPTIDGRPAVHPLGFDNGGYIAINKKSKNIDAAIKTMSYIHYINLEVLAQGIMTPAQVGAYLLPSNSGLGSMPMFLLNDPVNEVRAFEQIREAALTEDVSKITSGNTLAKYTTAHDWVTKGDPNGIGNWLQDYADRSAYMVTYNIVKENRFVLSRIMGPVPDEAAGYDPGSGLVEGFTKIIIGQEPVSYFDTLVREWKAAGGDIQTQAINKEYNR